MRTGFLKATPLGLEPRMTEPKSVVLPITPRGRTEQSVAVDVDLLKSTCGIATQIFAPAGRRFASEILGHRLA